MPAKNLYAKRSKISEAKFRQLIRYFAVDLDVSQITQLICLNRNSVNRYLRAIRERITEFCENQSPFSGEVEVDESFFGARRIKGKRGRGASSKTIVFGILKRHGKSILKLFLIAPKPLCKPLSEFESPWKASSTPTDGVTTMDLSMSDMKTSSRRPWKR